MKYIKSYNIFTSLSHRLVLHLLSPLSGMLLSLVSLLSLRETEVGGQMNVSVFGMAFSCIFLATYAVSMDGKVFGGSMRRGESRIDYLKCSLRGTEVYRNALIGDQILRLLTHLLLSALCGLLSLLFAARSPRELVTEWLLFAAGSWVISQIGILIGRLLKFDAQVAVVGTLLMTWSLAFGMVMVSWEGEPRTIRILLLTVVCFLIGAALGVWMVRQSVTKKGEEYHDC